MDGQFSSPPEDVGGESGYEHFLEALSDPAHKEHEDVKTWVRPPFDPMAFSIGETTSGYEKSCGCAISDKISFNTGNPMWENQVSGAPRIGCGVDGELAAPAS